MSEDTARDDDLDVGAEAEGPNQGSATASDTVVTDNDGGGGGYGKPPKHSQFKPGQSGNPRGRAKGARGLGTLLKSEMREIVTITENGKAKRVSKLQVVIKALAAKAAKGDVNAADKLLSLIIQSQGFDDERKTAKKLSDSDQDILDRFLSGGSPDFPSIAHPQTVPADAENTSADNPADAPHD